ncbi:MAG: alpha/beta hydrolase, partial [Phycisphaerae bacterium]|nr:alpha/beta hydrolase [Phycisphaerae bacterium]
PTNTREWLTVAHAQMAGSLDHHGQRVMLTEDMVDNAGQPRDVYAWFGRPVWTLNKFVHNWYGMIHTAQSCSRAEAIDSPAPAWPNFETVWIPVADGVQLHGRLALARDANGQPLSTDCIVLIPGFLGDNAVLRTRDLAAALLCHKFHVLALELRGHGRVEHYFPDLYYTFGIFETQDMLRVSEWIEDSYSCVRNTGLIGFCWGANHALLTAWYDGRSANDPNISPRLARVLEPPSPRRHYTAGIMAFSPVLRWEDLLDRTDVPHQLLEYPPMHLFQEVVKGRMRRKEHPEVTGNLRHLINYEFARSQLGPSFPIVEGYQFLRLLPYRGQPDGDKLESTRVPLLMVTAINDPFLYAQDMADMTARTHNPLVASLILRGGGHIGFAPYNASYFYSLILNFFDPQTGPATLIGTRR